MNTETQGRPEVDVPNENYWNLQHLRELLDGLSTSRKETNKVLGEDDADQLDTNN